MKFGSFGYDHAAVIMLSHFLIPTILMQRTSWKYNLKNSSSSLGHPSPLTQIKTTVASAVMIGLDRRAGYNQLTRAAKHRVAGLIACSVVGYKRAIIEAVTRTCYPSPLHNNPLLKSTLPSLSAAGSSSAPTWLETMSSFESLYILTIQVKMKTFKLEKT